MSTVVPQIAAIKPNQEVKPFFESNRDSIQAAIDYLTGDADDSPDGGGGEIVLQRGDYGTGQGSNAIGVPPTVFINALPGANISDITFIDIDGNTTPSTRLFRYERINDITEGIVEAIEGTDGISSTGTDQTNGLSTGVVTIGLDENGVKEESIAPLSPQAFDINISQETNEDFVYIAATRINDTDFAFDIVESTNIRTLVDTGNGLKGDNVNTPIQLDVAPENQNNVALSFDNEGVLNAVLLDDSVTSDLIEDNSITIPKIDTSSSSDNGEVLFTSNTGFNQRKIEAGDIDADSGTFQGNGTISFQSNTHEIDSGTINLGDNNNVIINIGSTNKIDSGTNSISIENSGGFSIEIEDNRITIKNNGSTVFEFFDGFMKFNKTISSDNAPTTGDAGSGLILYAQSDGGSTNGPDFYQVNSEGKRDLTNT